MLLLKTFILSVFLTFVCGVTSAHNSWSSPGNENPVLPGYFTINRTWVKGEKVEIYFVNGKLNN